MAGAIEMYQRSVEEFGQRVMAIGGSDWARPTPCADWSVRDLVRHLVYEELWTPPLLAGATVADVGDRFEGDILGDDPQVAWKEAAAQALAAATPGVLERTVHLSFGDFPGPGVPRPAHRRPHDPRLGPRPGRRTPTSASTPNWCSSSTTSWPPRPSSGPPPASSPLRSTSPPTPTCSRSSSPSPAAPRSWDGGVGGFGAG